MKGTGVSIAHLDADCFYVSAERVRFAELRGVSVGVLGNQGACVIAKSYEMKSHGVKTGMPIWEALKLCPSGAYVKRDFRWYEVLSRRMFDVVKEYSREVEYYSIDEFFFRVRGQGCSLFPLARSIQAAIMERVGVPVSIGVARSRTLAKLVSDTVKPFGVGVLTDDAAEIAFLKDIPVTEISGIAGRRAKRLSPWGITTCLDLRAADRRLVRSLLTATGEAIWWELQGDPVQPIHTQRTRHKVLSRGGSFGESTDSPLVIYAWLVRNLERLIEELEFHALAAGKLTVWVSYRSGACGSGTTKLTTPSDRFDVLLDAGRFCLRKAYVPRHAAMRMHLIAEELSDHRPVQISLFEKQDDRAREMAGLKRRVNERFGRFVLRSGATLPLYAIYQDHANGYDICDIRGKTCF
jgi:nucleotidyltransferase/DNA polymerase involved in DNA repair